jgi:hypothetical protein
MGSAHSSDTMVKTQGHILIIMQQLLDCTGQLALCEEDPGMEIAPLADACRRHLLALQQTISTQGNHEGATLTLGQFVARNSKESVEIKEMLHSLIDQTDRCIEVLGHQLECTAQELASLRRSQTAIRAYRGR